MRLDIIVLKLSSLVGLTLYNTDKDKMVRAEKRYALSWASSG